MLGHSSTCIARMHFSCLDRQASRQIHTLSLSFSLAARACHLKMATANTYTHRWLCRVRECIRVGLPVRISGAMCGTQFCNQFVNNTPGWICCRITYTQRAQSFANGQQQTSISWPPLPFLSLSLPGCLPVNAFIISSR